jgi:hypothetical protein
MIDAAAFTRLCPADQLAVCKALQLPLPTPGVPLDVILIQHKLPPQAALSRLERSTDLRAMIATACLKGVLTKCPDSAQLKPKPYPKPQPPKPAQPSPRSPVARAAKAARVLVSHVPNPKQKGSKAYGRYALYQDGLTEAELLARGITREDLRWDGARQHLTWRPA